MGFPIGFYFVRLVFLWVVCLYPPSRAKQTENCKNVFRVRDGWQGGGETTQKTAQQQRPTKWMQKNDNIIQKNLEWEWTLDCTKHWRRRSDLCRLTCGCAGQNLQWWGTTPPTLFRSVFPSYGGVAVTWNTKYEFRGCSREFVESGCFISGVCIIVAHVLVFVSACRWGYQKTWICISVHMFCWCSYYHALADRPPSCTVRCLSTTKIEIAKVHHKFFSTKHCIPFLLFLISSRHDDSNIKPFVGWGRGFWIPCAPLCQQWYDCSKHAFGLVHHVQLNFECFPKQRFVLGIQFQCLECRPQSAPFTSPCSSPIWLQMVWTCDDYISRHVDVYAVADSIFWFQVCLRRRRRSNII